MYSVNHILMIIIFNIDDDYLKFRLYHIFLKFLSEIKMESNNELHNQVISKYTPLLLYINFVIIGYTKRKISRVFLYI